jgi:hypothetical protein
MIALGPNQVALNINLDKVTKYIDVCNKGMLNPKGDGKFAKPRFSIKNTEVTWNVFFSCDEHLTLDEANYVCDIYHKAGWEYCRILPYNVLTKISSKELNFFIGIAVDRYSDFIEETILTNPEKVECFLLFNNTKELTFGHKLP